MQDLSDEELDGLFKEAAENHHVLHDPEAWQDIASRLDNEAIPAGASGYLKWIIPALLLLGGAGGLLLWKNQTKPPVPVAQPAAAKTPEAKKATGTLHSTAKPDEAMMAKPLRATTSVARANPPKPGNQSGLSEQQSFFLARQGASSGDGKRSTQMEATRSPTNQALNQPEPEVGLIDSTNKNEIDNRTLTESPTKVDSVETGIVALSDTVAISLDSSSVAKKEKQKIQGKRWFLQWGISPDFSSVHYFKPGAMGFNAGLSFGYRLSTRWSTQVGVVWARKLYNTREVESAYGYAGYNLKVAALDGNCRVLDLSANVHYDIVQRDRSAIFLGAGLSSYMMMAEDYTYWCLTPSGKGPYPYDQHLRHANNDWFKMLDLSIGIDRKISRSISLQAEPFIKAPLSGVGEGKISLVSAGAFINLKWMIR